MFYFETESTFGSTFAQMNIKAFQATYLFDNINTFCAQGTLQMQLLSYNAGNHETSKNFKTLLVPDQDLYVVAIQEVDTNPVMFVSPYISQQIQTFIDVLQPFTALKYEVKFHQMGSQIMFCISKQPVTFLAFQGVARGKMGAQNKGGILLTIKVKDSVFSFLGCHLNAERGPSGQQKRNEDLWQILNNVKTQQHPLSSMIAERTPLKEKNMKDRRFNRSNLDIFNTTDALFIVGDLNYRCDVDEPEEVVGSKLINDDRFRFALQQFDQLKLQMDYLETLPGYEAGKSIRIPNGGIGNTVYQYFEEPCIQFLPTYKLSRSTNIYVTEEGKARMPSYCDRIIYRRNLPDCNINVTEYKSYHDFLESDHRPVTQIVKISYRTIDNLLLNNQLLVINQSFKQQFELLKPKLQMDQSAFTFQQSKYGVTTNQLLQITNQHDLTTAEVRIISKFKGIFCQPEVFQVLPNQTAQVHIFYICDHIHESLNKVQIDTSISIQLIQDNKHIVEEKTIPITIQAQNNYTNYYQDHIDLFKQYLNTVLKEYSVEQQMVSTNQIKDLLLDFQKHKNLRLATFDLHEFNNIAMLIESKQQIVGSPSIILYKFLDYLTSLTPISNDSYILLYNFIVQSQKEGINRSISFLEQYYLFANAVMQESEIELLRTTVSFAQQFFDYAVVVDQQEKRLAFVNVLSLLLVSVIFDKKQSWEADYKILSLFFML